MLRVFAVDLTEVAPSLTTFKTFGDLVNVIVQNAFVLAGVISFVLLVFGGFSVIMGAGSGDTKKLDQGKQAITGAVVGLIIVVTSLWLVQIIETLTGVSLLKPK
ncbi:MAG: hypothetical protein ACOY0S_04715 [Patescibacteria group bacterium]